MSAARIFLGVDGGGTKTEFVCMDDKRNVIAKVITGTTYHLQVGFDGAVRQLEDGVATVCARSGILPAHLAHAFFGLPAFGEDSMVDPRLQEACGRILGHERYTCGNDMICGWAGSLGCEDGINIVAGTGSIGYGERQGRSARVGGWGEMFSDEGSAYWIAVQGLNAFTRMSDGRLPAGPLLEVFRHALGLSCDLDICARIMGEGGMGRDQVASLAQIVSDAADQTDPVARQILKSAGQTLAEMAGALRIALGFASDEVALLSWSGGVLTQQDLVRRAFRDSLDVHGPFACTAPRYTPGFGAALYAGHLGRAWPA